MSEHQREALEVAANEVLRSIATDTPPADAALELLATYLEQKGLDYAYGSYPQEMLNKAAAALRARQPAQAVVVPEGFVMVPVEPDIETLKRMHVAYWGGHISNYWHENSEQLWRKTYAALLAASKGEKP